MRIWRRRTAGVDTGELASHATLHSATGKLTPVISAIALVFSAYSLWETSLKQADLSVYVTDVAIYSRDHLNEDAASRAGGYEVLAVPVTIANAGARDGAVVALRLDARDAETGQAVRFDAAYTVEAPYFTGGGGSAERPKAPFAALVISGRSSWSGTVLFYSSDFKHQKLIGPKTRIEAKLTAVTPPPRGWLARVLGRPVEPVAFTLEMPDVWDMRLGVNTLTRMRSAAARP